MRQVDAIQIFRRLKAAFPAMALDEAAAEVYIRELALLHDARILDMAVTDLIQRDEKFPAIAHIRGAYRTLNEVAAASRAQLERQQYDPGPNDIPTWMHVWRWQLDRTLEARQEARNSKLPVGERHPVKMREFPQLPNPDENAYSWEDYAQMEAEWVEAGSPRFGAAEILQVIA